MTSFVSAKGPSVTVTLPPAHLCTRTPVAPKCTPSVAISHPAFMPSSMSLPIVAISASVGGRFVRSCANMLMKRMSILLGLTSPAAYCRTVGSQIDHYVQNLLASLDHDSYVAADRRQLVLNGAAVTHYEYF